jgi:hypothetical protein
MLNWNDYGMKQEQYRDLMRAADKQRVIRQAEVKHYDGNMLRRQMLDWLGRCLIAWGWRLRARYGY